MDPFRKSENPRPWLVLSDASHPFHGEEYVCATMTTTEREIAISVGRSDWVDGGSDVRSFVSPWSPMTVKHEAVRKRQGTVRKSVVRRVAEEVTTYVQPW
jgi:mRNA-degrading endonuclease toxin of MazEF toxin-antitoxin module